MQVVIPITWTWSISYITYYSSHSFGHITSHSIPCKNKLDVIVVACFTWLLWVSSKNVSYLRKSHNGDMPIAIYPSQGPFSSNPIRLKWERLAPASHLYATSACQSVAPVSRKRTSKVGLGRFIPWCRRIKIRLVMVSKLNKYSPTTTLCSTRA